MASRGERSRMQNDIDPPHVAHQSVAVPHIAEHKLDPRHAAMLLHQEEQLTLIIVDSQHAPRLSAQHLTQQLAPHCATHARYENAASYPRRLMVGNHW
jgi:hypothetical protein